MIAEFIKRHPYWTAIIVLIIIAVTLGVALFIIGVILFIIYLWRKRKNNKNIYDKYIDLIKMLKDKYNEAMEKIKTKKQIYYSFGINYFILELQNDINKDKNLNNDEKKILINNIKELKSFGSPRYEKFVNFDNFTVYSEYESIIFSKNNTKYKFENIDADYNLDTLMPNQFNIKEDVHEFSSFKLYDHIYTKYNTKEDEYYVWKLTIEEKRAEKEAIKPTIEEVKKEAEEEDFNREIYKIKTKIDKVKNKTYVKEYMRLEISNVTRKYNKMLLLDQIYNELLLTINGGNKSLDKFNNTNITTFNLNDGIINVAIKSNIYKLKPNNDSVNFDYYLSNIYTYDEKIDDNIKGLKEFSINNLKYIISIKSDKLMWEHI